MFINREEVTGQYILRTIKSKISNAIFGVLVKSHDEITEASILKNSLGWYIQITAKTPCSLTDWWKDIRDLLNTNTKIITESTMLKDPMIIKGCVVGVEFTAMRWNSSLFLEPVVGPSLERPVIGSVFIVILPDCWFRCPELMVNFQLSAPLGFPGGRERESNRQTDFPKHCDKEMTRGYRLGKCTHLFFKRMSTTTATFLHVLLLCHWKFKISFCWQGTHLSPFMWATSYLEASSRWPWKEELS